MSGTQQVSSSAAAGPSQQEIKDGQELDKVMTQMQKIGISTEHY